MSSSSKTTGLNPQRLQRIDQHLRTRYLEPGKLPCALTLVERRGEIAHFSALGSMDLERERPLREDTIFRIYSMTKPVTSVAFMMLVEEGLISLEDPVHRFIPQWRDLGVYEGGFLQTFRTRRTSAPMRVIDLLRHTAGLTYGFQQRTNVDAAYRKQGLGEIGSRVPLQEMIDGLARMPLEFSPGQAWNYSVATDVLGYLIEVVSGQSFAEFLHARIFAPLGMVDTDFHVPASKAARLAACYQALPGGKKELQDDPTKSPYLSPPTFYSGGGGLVSTAADYLRFCRMLRNGGKLDGARILSPKTLQLMTSNHLPDGKDLTQLSMSMFSEATYAGVGFGLGFSVTLNPARTLLPGTVGDFSWGGMASTYFWVDPVEELIVIFLTQLMPSATYPLRRELRTLVYSAFDT